MASSEKVVHLLSRLKGYRAKLGILAEIPKSAFLSDFTKVESAKHLLQVSIECCLDMAHYLIASEGWRSPTNYAEAFAVLAEHGVVSAELMPTLAQMVRFRNRLVHLYWELDEETVYDILQNHLPDFDAFAHSVLGYIRTRN